MTDQIPRFRLSQSPPSLRPATAVDQPVLLQIFTESHCADLMVLGLDATALAGLVGMQYRARHGQYRSGNPGAVEYLITDGGGSPIGSCWLDDTPGRLRVLDIAVLAEHRRRGVARAVLGSLCEQAAAQGRPVRLSVWHQNLPALELYRSLGFGTVPDGAGGADDGDPADLGNGYLELQWVPDRAPRPRAGAR